MKQFTGIFFVASLFPLPLTTAMVFFFDSYFISTPPLRAVASAISF
jgi:hypothetical protein